MLWKFSLLIKSSMCSFFLSDARKAGLRNICLMVQIVEFESLSYQTGLRTPCLVKVCVFSFSFYLDKLNRQLKSDKVTGTILDRKFAHI
jgi:hypothetical protein